MKAFVGKHCCRYCRMDLKSIRSKVNSLGAIERNRENYDVDVAINNQTDTGIFEYSPFNRIPFFHVTESSSVCLDHDITLGTLRPNLSASILHFINEKFFTLENLNDRMCSIKYGETEQGNMPMKIEMRNLIKYKLKMTISEMFFFAHHFTIMIGHFVPDNDPVWQHVLTTIGFMDLCYLPSYDPQDICALRVESEKVNQGMKDLFNLTLIHKAHLATHYHMLTERFGPMRYVKTLR